MISNLDRLKGSGLLIAQFESFLEEWTGGEPNLAPFPWKEEDVRFLGTLPSPIQEFYGVVHRWPSANLSIFNAHMFHLPFPPKCREHNSADPVIFSAGNDSYQVWWSMEENCLYQSTNDPQKPQKIDTPLDELLILIGFRLLTEHGERAEIDRETLSKESYPLISLGEGPEQNTVQYYPDGFLSITGEAIRQPSKMAPEVVDFNRCDDEDFYPLDERILFDGRVTSFESQTTNIKTEANATDLKMLGTIPKLDVWYGAGSCRIYPFICLPTIPLDDLPTARAVLELLRASCFESEHISDLDRVSIDFPGYHPHTKNDEIHNDPFKQHLFPKPEPDEDEIEISADDPGYCIRADEARDAHNRIRNYVKNQFLHYVLIHAKPREIEGYQFSDYVVLFGVGVSPGTGNLVGVVSSQICKNLCD